MFDCKINFRSKYQEDLSCRICKETSSLENEDHLLNCKLLCDDEDDVQFSDVNGGVDKQLKAVQVFKKIHRKMKVYLEIAEQS